jgi:hypothetical protein
MFSMLKALIRRAYVYHRSVEITRWLEELRRTPRALEPLRLTRFGQKAFSQSDEDGMILEIFKRIGVQGRKFVEFGVEEGVECNTALLLVDGWHGLWMDASARHVSRIRTRHGRAAASGALATRLAAIDAENIDGLLAQWSGGSPAAPAQIDLLSIDIDGNDYWVWQAIKSVSARVVVIEYNATYPPPVEFIRAYDPAALWGRDDYFGASLTSLEKLGRDLGYALVGCSLSGANAFFVREDALTGPDGAARFHAPYTAEEHFEPPRYQLTWLQAGHPPRFGENAAPGLRG